VVAELRAEMGRQELTNSAMAEKIGVSDMWVGRRIRGVIPMTIADLTLFADALDVPVSRLVDAAERRPASVA
jgi:transcriptional regulator with XRE-family HTH domain